MFLIVVVAVAYLFYNTEFFRFADVVLEVPKLGRGKVYAAFILNYIIFIICTIMKLHLIVNWTIFAVVLYVEVQAFYRKPVLSAYYCGLTGSMIGLAVNIFFRSLIAAAANVPLAAFDNNISSANMKVYPVLIGFIATGLYFTLACSARVKEKTRLIIQDDGDLKFLVRFMTAMYAYLVLNLLAYYTPGNILILKLWGIKSCLFVLVGLYMAHQFAYKMSKLNRYRTQNSATRRELDSRIREEQELIAIKYTDTLTGGYNRQFVDEKLQEQLNGCERFALCFADLDHLKAVNDEFGHEMGDEYILKVSSELHKIREKDRALVCRYGGDEFILLFPNMGMEKAKRLVDSVRQNLDTANASNAFPFRLSVSFGLSEGTLNQDVKSIIREADRKMYIDKADRRKLE